MKTKTIFFICGFMASGKTSHGKKLAKNLGYHFIDLDEYTENKFDKNITEIFKDEGEKQFREFETTSLNECINTNQKTIVALGGGTPCFNNNLNLIKDNGYLIYLKMDAEPLYKRVFGIKSQRPLLANQEEKDMLKYINDLLATREEFYKQADVILYNNNLQEDELKQTVLDFINK